MAVQAFAQALVGTDAESQQLLLGYMGAALTDIGANLGCATALDVLTTIKGTDVLGDPAVSLPAVSLAQLLLLCTAVHSCPTSCGDLGLA